MANDFLEFGLPPILGSVADAGTGIGQGYVQGLQLRQQLEQNQLLNDLKKWQMQMEQQKANFPKWSVAGEGMIAYQDPRSGQLGFMGAPPGMRQGQPRAPVAFDPGQQLFDPNKGTFIQTPGTPKPDRKAFDTYQREAILNLYGVDPWAQPIVGIEGFNWSDVMKGAKEAERKEFEEKERFKATLKTEEVKPPAGYAFSDDKKSLKPIPGGPAAKPEPTKGEVARDQAFGKEYAEFVASGGYADIQKQLGQLRSVSQELKDDPSLTGPWVGELPDFVRTKTNPRAIAVRDSVEEVVQRNLRLILGAQFTEREGIRLIARAYNEKAEPSENKKRVDRLITQIEKAAQTKQEAAEYFEQHGTLSGWKGKLPSISDFDPDVPNVDETKTPKIAEPVARPSPSSPSEPGIGKPRVTLSPDTKQKASVAVQQYETGKINEMQLKQILGPIFGRQSAEQYVASLRKKRLSAR